MFNKIVRKIRAGNATHRPQFLSEKLSLPVSHNQAFARLNELAPLASETPPAITPELADNLLLRTGSASQSIVCRETILGQDQRVAGYAFMLRHRVNERVRDSSTNIRGLYDEVLLLNLQAMQIQRLLEHRMAFITLSASSIFLPIVEQLPAEGTVYVVGSNEGFNSDIETTINRLSSLKTLGYRLALHGSGIDRVELAGIVSLADFVILDIGNSDIPSIRLQIEFSERLAPHIQFVATNIPTREDFNVCMKLPFSLFHGSFITRREEWNNRCLDAARIRTMMLLNKLRKDVELDELSALIRQDPALVVRLMRYANSPGIGLLQKAGTIDQALMVLGRQQLYRWATLLLFTGGESNDFMRPLLENALIRARLAELLAQDKLVSNEREELFLAGMISLMDVLLGVPMEAVLKQLGLPRVFEETLLGQNGALAPFLNLAIACERHDAGNIHALSSAIGLDEKTVNKLHIEAMVWAQQSMEN